MIISRQSRPFSLLCRHSLCELSAFADLSFWNGLFYFFSSFQSYYSTVFRMCHSFENTVTDTKEKHYTRRPLPPVPISKGQWFVQGDVTLKPHLIVSHKICFCALRTNWLITHAFDMVSIQPAWLNNKPWLQSDQNQLSECHNFAEFRTDEISGL